jgi:hypothetical protein
VICGAGFTNHHCKTFAIRYPKSDIKIYHNLDKNIRHPTSPNPRLKTMFLKTGTKSFALFKKIK